MTNGEPTKDGESQECRPQPPPLNSGIFRARFLPTSACSARSPVRQDPSAMPTFSCPLRCLCCLCCHRATSIPLLGLLPNTGLDCPAHGISRHMHRLALPPSLIASLRRCGRFYAFRFSSLYFSVPPVPSRQLASALLFGHYVPVPFPVDDSSLNVQGSGILALAGHTRSCSAEGPLLRDCLPGLARTRCSGFAENIAVSFFPSPMVTLSLPIWGTCDTACGSVIAHPHRHEYTRQRQACTVFW